MNTSQNGKPLLSPLKFELNVKRVIWGGERIASFKGVRISANDVGENWEVSGISGRESVVAEGPDKGLNLRELIGKYRGALVGRRVYRKNGDEFPLLVKLIDARRDLSVQVHPDDKLAQRRHGCKGKAEMWYVIDTEPGAVLYAGMHRTITPARYQQHVREHTLLSAVQTYETHAGDVFYLPPGRIHAIGAGNLIAEIQQPSDITYRIYDYDRLDADGNPRELHTEFAADAIDYTVSPDCKRNYREVNGMTELINSIFFKVNRIIVESVATYKMPHDAFLVLMCIGGETTLETVAGTTTLRRGETVLIPACIPLFTLHGHATLLTATV